MKKYYSFLIMVSLALMFAASGTMQAQVSVWDGSAEPWTHGSGTEEDPYLIESAANLAWLSQKCQPPEPRKAHHYMDTCFLLTVDLDLGGAQGLEWVPIGGPFAFYNAFAGHFDGGNHTVDNMLILGSFPDVVDGVLCYGLFGKVDCGSIRNLTMGEHCLIEIGDGYDYSSYYVGMLVGNVCSFNNHYLEWFFPYSISNCHNLGNINVSLHDDREIVGVGGLVGFSGPSLRMENCSNAGALSLETPMRRIGFNERYGGPSVGGLVGVNYDMYAGHMVMVDGVPSGPIEFVMEDCHNTGVLHLGLDLRDYIEFKRAYAGGIIGNAGYHVTIDHCSNRGDVDVQVGSSTGLTDYDIMLFCSGIAGGYGNDFHIISWDHNAIFNVNVTNCYNHASVRCEVEEGLAVETTVSGISGCAISESELVPELHVSNCYHVGELIADEANGITPADTLEVLEVNNSYYLEGNAPDNGIGTPKTDEEMKSQAFVDLLNGDGPVTFYFDEWGVNGGYPVLDDKKPFLANSEWYYEIVMADGRICYQYLQCAGDTTIGSERPKVVVRTNQIYDKESIEVTHEYLLERNDMVYWWNKELEEFTVLYDFRAEAGDEWVIKVGRESVKVHVDAVETYDDPETGRTYRMLRVSDQGNIFSGEIICGIGHTTSLFPEKLMGHRAKFQVDGLRCYWNNQVLVLHTSTDDCDAIYSQFHGVDETILTEGVRVYPNPTDGIIVVETQDLASLQGQTTEYRITNIMGQTLMSGMSLQPNLTLDVSSLPAGIYFISIGQYTTKFIVNQ